MGGRGNVGMGKGEVQTVGYKIGSRMYCIALGILPIFCNNCKWKINFKNYMKTKKRKRETKKKDKIDICIVVSHGKLAAVNSNVS